MADPFGEMAPFDIVSPRFADIVVGPPAPTVSEALDEFARKAAQIHGLTPRETQVLRDLAAGGSYKDVAMKRQISAETVKLHAKRLRTKLGIESCRELLVSYLRLSREAGVKPTGSTRTG